MSGSSKLTLSGIMGNAVYHASGASHIMADKLHTEYVVANASGASVVKVTAKKVYKNVSGVASVTIREL